MPATNAASEATGQVVRFDCFEADLQSGLLLRRGLKVPLREQSFQVLACLLQRPGQVVSREDLRRQLWRDDVFVDFEKSLNSAVARLRQALGDSANHPRFIETVPKHGYRFLTGVRATSATGAGPASQRTRLAVLPFANRSGDAAQEYFSDAMTDEIITALAALAPERLAVIARTTAMRYKDTHKDVARIGRELDVDYVVEGGVLRGERRVAVNVQLVTTSDQTHVFAKKYDAEMGDLFGLHNRVARDIGGQIPGAAGGARTDAMLRGRARKPTEDLAAYNEYIQGRYFMSKWTPGSVAEARRHLEAAIARDPAFALAYDALAELCWYLGFWGFAPPAEMDLIGRGYALRAVEIDDTLAETHAMLGFFPKAGYWDWEEVLRCAERGRSLNPASPVVQSRYAMALLVAGRTGEAITELEGALESDPLSLELRGWFAEALYLGRRYDRAIEQARLLAASEPEHFLAHMVLGHVYLGPQRYEESAAALRKSVELSGGFPLVLGWLGLALGLGRHREEARAVLERLRAIAQQAYVPPTSFAWTHLGLGDLDDAFLWLDRAAEAHDRMANTLKTYPFLDPLRADPRFHALLRKMNLDS